MQDLYIINSITGCSLNPRSIPQRKVEATTQPLGRISGLLLPAAAGAHQPELLVPIQNSHMQLS